MSTIRTHTRQLVIAIATSGLALLGTTAHSRAQKEQFDRSKPHVNIGTIGHVDHGKTTLTAAIGSLLKGPDGKPAVPRIISVRDIDCAPEEKERGITINTSHIEYDSPARHYTHVDCPGHADYVKNMITGAAPMDGAILVVSASEGLREVTRDEIALAGRVGLPAVLVFLNQSAGIPDDPAVQEDILRELTRAGFDPVKVPVLRGDPELALAGDPDQQRNIEDLIFAMDEFIPFATHSDDKSFLMPVEDVFTITGRGTVATGRIETGIINPGEEVEILGLGASLATTVTGVEMVRSLHNSRLHPSVQLSLEDIKKSEIRRGMVIAKPGSITPHSEFKAEVYVLKKEEGGRHTPFHNKYRPQFYLRTTDVTGEIQLEDGREMVMPGDNVTISVKLIVPVAINKGLRFAVRQGGRTVGAGQVTEIVK